MLKRNITIFYLGDIRFDSRLLKMINTLAKSNYYIKLFSFFDFKIEPSIILDNLKKDIYFSHQNIEIEFVRLKIKNKIPFISYYIKALVLGFKSKTDYFLCPDLYSLPIACILSFLKRSKYVYDSRELFSSLASLNKKKIKQYIWSFIENIFVIRSSHIFTVNDSIKKILHEKYKNKDIYVIHNFPSLLLYKDTYDLHQKIQYDESKKILLYQGGLQAGRGISILLEIITFLDDCNLLFLGNGCYKNIIKKHPLFNKRVFLLENILASNILSYTSNAFLGLSIIENYGKSYYLSLPNKIFEYCHAGVPVIASNFPEIRKYIMKYKIGELVDPEDIQSIIMKIKFLINNENIYNYYKQNCINARTILNWESQESKLIQAFR